MVRLLFLAISYKSFMMVLKEENPHFVLLLRQGHTLYVPRVSFSCQ